MAETTRRRFLETAGGTAISALAGCADDGDGTVTSGDSEDMPVGTTTGSLTTTAPETPAPVTEGDWPMFGLDIANSRAAPLEPATKGEPRWEVSISGSEASPAIVGGRAYLPTDEGGILVLDTDDGSSTQLYSAEDGEEEEKFISTPAVSDDSVYVAGRDVHAVDRADGSVLWRTDEPLSRFADLSRAGPVVDNGDLYCVDTHGGRVVAFDAADGGNQWQFETEGEIIASPAVTDDAVFVYATDDRLYAVAREAGEELWRRDMGTPDGSPVQPGAGSPTVWKDTVLIGSRSLYAMDAKDGSLKWEYYGGVPEAGVAVGDGIVYFGGRPPLGEAGTLHAVDAESGDQIWGSNVPGRSAPALVDDTLYIMDEALRAVDAADGSELWTYPSVGPDMSGEPVPTDGAVVVNSDSLEVYAIE